MAIYIGNQKVSVKGGLPVEVVEEVGEQVDFTLANATESDVLSGKTFYAQDSTLKTGTLEMASEFSIPVFTGDLSSTFVGNKWNWLIEGYGDKITTEDAIDCNQMFNGSSTLQAIPFEINCKEGTNCNCHRMFYGCNSLRNVPKINNCKISSIYNMFYDCHNLRHLPEDFESWFDWSYIVGYGTGFYGIFYNCYSLRQFPSSIFNHAYPSMAYSSAIYKDLASNCYALDEIIDLPVPYQSTKDWTSSAFSSPFFFCCRVKNVTFATQNGQPYEVNWKSQAINLAYYVGYSNSPNHILNYNSGITYETRITDDTTYQLYKNHPDSWTTDVNYSRYNHDSAVATINSLPDTSAYLLANGGTNTIKFAGASGSLTDGGAINTLTEEEIAVATAKGWTVTFS